LSAEEGEQGQNHEVDAAGEIRHFVHLEGGGDREEDDLHGHRDDGTDGEVVLVEDVNSHFFATRVQSLSWKDPRKTIENA
jgi:hypothetical protein